MLCITGYNISNVYMLCEYIIKYMTDVVLLKTWKDGVRLPLTCCLIKV
jgi:hypothetical protein